MYHCHGWAVVSDSPKESDPEALAQLARRVELRVAQIASENPLVVFRAVNGEYHLAVSGFRNHYGEHVSWVVELFYWISSVAPGSYGLLYAWDDEDPNGHNNEFQVWVMAKGRLVQQSDAYLSPCIPKIEDPFDADFGVSN